MEKEEIIRGARLIGILIAVSVGMYYLFNELRAEGIYFHELSHQKNSLYIDGCKNTTISIDRERMRGETVSYCNTSKETQIAHAITEAVGYNLMETNSILYVMLFTQVMLSTLGILVMMFMLTKIEEKLEWLSLGIR
jgi:hypothetical protein